MPAPRSDPSRFALPRFAAPSSALPRLAPRDAFVPRCADDGRAAVQAWLDHVEAGRIGTVAAASPACEARRRRMAALLRPGPRRSVW